MKRVTTAIVLLFVLLYVLPLGVRPLVAPDECRYGEIPREMIATGNWSVPKLGGLLYFEKPVLGYWLNAASIMLFGENPFSVRLPSALAAGLSALLLFLLAKRFLSGHSAGLLAASILLTSCLPFLIGVFAVLDSMLALFVTAAMVSFFFAYSEQSSRRKMAFLVLFGIACGLAFLTKGFLAFAVPVVTIVPFLLWEKKWKELFKLPWIPMVAAFLVALPWSIRVHMLNDDFWRYFVMDEHIKRFFSAGRPQHPEPFWFFLPVLLGGVMPWTFLVPAAFRGLGRDKAWGSLTRYAICWLVFPLLFFSASKGKLGTYILPCMPPAALLLTSGFLAYFAAGRRKSFNAGALACAALMLLVAVVFLLNQLCGVFGGPLARVADIPRFYGPEEALKWILLISGVIAWVVFCILSARHRDSWKKLALFAMGPVLFLFSLHLAVPSYFMVGKAPVDFLRRYAEHVRDDTILVSDNYVTPAVGWAYHRTDIMIFGGQGEFTYGLDADPDRWLGSNVTKLNALIREHRGTRRVTMIHDMQRYEKIRHVLPKPVFLRDDDSGYVFMQY